MDKKELLEKMDTANDELYRLTALSEMLTYIASFSPDEPIVQRNFGACMDILNDGINTTVDKYKALVVEAQQS